MADETMTWFIRRIVDRLTEGGCYYGIGLLYEDQSGHAGMLNISFSDPLFKCIRFTDEGDEVIIWSPKSVEVHVPTFWGSKTTTEQRLQISEIRLRRKPCVR